MGVGLSRRTGARSRAMCPLPSLARAAVLAFVAVCLCGPCVLSAVQGGVAAEEVAAPEPSPAVDVSDMPDAVEEAADNPAVPPPAEKCL